MQTEKSIKHNKYLFKVGDYAWIVPQNAKEEDGHKVLIKVKKRLLRPFTASTNFYLCEHQIGQRKFNKVHFEEEMKKLEETNELI